MGDRNGTVTFLEELRLGENSALKSEEIELEKLKPHGRARPKT